jgi:hypothetical protein
MREIVLRNDVRCFKPAFSSGCPILAKMDRYLAGGETVLVGDPITKTYDHRDQLAVPFEWRGNEGFLLHDEVISSLAAITVA